MVFSGYKKFPLSCRSDGQGIYYSVFYIVRHGMPIGQFREIGEYT